MILNVASACIYITLQVELRNYTASCFYAPARLVRLPHPFEVPSAEHVTNSLFLDGLQIRIGPYTLIPVLWARPGLPFHFHSLATTYLHSGRHAWGFRLEADGLIPQMATYVRTTFFQVIA